MPKTELIMEKPEISSDEKEILWAWRQLRKSGGGRLRVSLKSNGWIYLSIHFRKPFIVWQSPNIKEVEETSADF